MAKVKCPHCNADIQVGENPQLGQVHTCENCGIRFEVVWLFPLALDYYEEDSKKVAQDSLDV